MKTYLSLLPKAFFFIMMCLICTSSTDKVEWGFFGHKRINRMAVFTLPPEMIGFYKKNIEYITEHAVDPDKRRYATKHEGVRHYIDIDHWGEKPFEEVPRHLNDAIIKFGELKLTTDSGETLTLLGEGTSEVNDKVILIKGKDTPTIFGKDAVTMDYKIFSDFYREHIQDLYYEDEWIIDGELMTELLAEFSPKVKVASAQMFDHFSHYGVLPYNLMRYQNILTKAFESGDASRILRASAEIGHYIGDAHVPLHTTENYNGQLTGQDGIHGFWESRLPELYADKNYNFMVGKAQYIENPRDYYWEVVRESHSHVEKVFAIEKELSQTFAQDKQYCYEERLERTILTQCEGYAEAFHERMGGMVESRMRASILSVGSVWFSAWIDAGQPNLKNIGKYELSKSELKAQKKEEKLFNAKPVKARAH